MGRARETKEGFEMKTFAVVLVITVLAYLVGLGFQGLKVEASGGSAGRIQIEDYKPGVNRVVSIDWSSGEVKKLKFENGQITEVDVDEDVNFMPKVGEYILAVQNGYILVDSGAQTIQDEQDQEETEADKREGEQN